ncbi:MAG: glycosyltransferase family 4 protein [Deltaproteobacteria bacterium]|nr:glycosyltransferase family 4 protein [Deltaproteobacteria bacterium]
MKVCIAIEKFDPHVGGAERYCWDLAHFLSQRSHDVAVICMKAAIPDTAAIKTFIIKPFKFPQFLRHLGFSLLHFFKARKMTDYIHFCVGNTFYMDIYQPHGGLHRAWFLRETLRYPEGIRSVCRIIKYINPKDVVQRLLEWWTFKMTKPEVIAISNMVATDIRSWFEYPGSRVHLLPNGIDVKKFTSDNVRHRDKIRSRYNIRRSDFVFLFMANNPVLKGFDVLISATRSLNDLPVKVLVIGPYNRKTKRKVKGLSNSIIFGGRASDPEFIYTACDCLVHPSFYDACSLVVLEALASEIPVITTKANGASMYITNKNGFVVPPGDHNALEEAMRDAFSGKAGKTVSSSFKNQETVFTDLERIIESYRTKQG